VQGERPLLTVIASFHANPTSPELATPPPHVSRPDQLPVLQDWARDPPLQVRRHARSWIEQPPPLDLRIGEAPTFLGGPSAEGPRSHWMRLPRDVGDDPLLHAALLAYASDYLLLDMAFRAYPERVAPGPLRRLAPPHAGDACHRRPPRAGPGRDPRRGRAPRSQRHAGGAGPPGTPVTRRWGRCRIAALRRRGPRASTVQGQRSVRRFRVNQPG